MTEEEATMRTEETEIGAGEGMILLTLGARVTAIIGANEETAKMTDVDLHIDLAEMNTDQEIKFNRRKVAAQDLVHVVE